MSVLCKLNLLAAAIVSNCLLSPSKTNQSPLIAMAFSSCGIKRSRGSRGERLGFHTIRGGERSSKGPRDSDGGVRRRPAGPQSRALGPPERLALDPTTTSDAVSPGERQNPAVTERLGGRGAEVRACEGRPGRPGGIDRGAEWHRIARQATGPPDTGSILSSEWLESNGRL